jgi:hypothetical protein
VAVVAEDGTVELDKNMVNGSEPMLRLIGGLPSGTPVAFEAAFGRGWLAQLLEDYGFDAHLVHSLRCKAIASARLKNDKGRCRHSGAAATRGSAALGVDRPAEGAPAATTSSFARMDPARLAAAADRLARDLDNGHWDRRHGHLRDLSEFAPRPTRRARTGCRRSATTSR